MTPGDKKRQKIFEIYRDNLNLLIDNGFIKGKKDYYLCPLCLSPHKSINEKDPLTLEDAPPKSLGGKPNILTCKSCNNTMGRTVDFHLAERLRELDSAKFIPGTEAKVQVKIGNETLQASVTIEPDGKIQLIHSRKNNNPIQLEEKMKELIPGTVVNMKFLKSRVIPDNLEFALLKTGYLLAFQKFGYSMILDECYKPVREQLKNTNTRIYPIGFWFQPPFPKDHAGVYFILEKGLECILSMFTVTTGKSERMFGVLLPLSINPISKVIIALNDKIEKEAPVAIDLFPSPENQAKMNYLSDKENVAQMYRWISDRSK